VPLGRNFRGACIFGDPSIFHWCKTSFEHKFANIRGH